MRYTVLLIIALILSACGTMWTHPTATQAQYRKDDYQCKLDAKMAKRIDFDLYNQCMELRGYRS